MTTSQITIESIAKVLVIDPRDRALILTIGEHRTNPIRSFTPDLPGGIVDPGESEQAGAIRETLEECNIQLDPQHVQLIYAATEHLPEQSKLVTKLLYVTHLTDTPSVTLSWEHSDYQWTPIEELHAIDFRPFFAEAIDTYLATYYQR